MQAKTLKALVAEHGVSFDAATIMSALINAGYAENFQHPSTTSSGEMKSFKRLTDLGQRFGVNKPPRGHLFKIDPKFFFESFFSMLNVVGVQLSAEIQTRSA
ncbi:hypothetical protein [Pseudomonas syringae]|uniref:hypothetical protein n=1 Tax=Pseudomonas syringae TaxID=317 RepID=UPI000B233C2A|nr:hypothetical protein [Pseudomonas syringae]